MAENSRKFEVLAGLKAILKFVEFYPGPISGIRIPIPWIFRTLFILLLMFLLTTVWICIDADWNLKKVSGPLCFVCGSSQILIIYLDMRTSKGIISEVMDSLQQLVRESE